jgi:hypothetical protein
MTVTHTYTTDTNRRAARCCGLNEWGCGVELAPGAGCVHDFGHVSPGSARVRYQCPDCHQMQLTMDRQRPEIDRLLDGIDEWCEYVNLGMGASVRLKIWGLVGMAGVAGLDLAERLADELPKLDDYGFGYVMAVVQRIAVETIPDQALHARFRFRWEIVQGVDAEFGPDYYLARSSA